MLSIFSALVLCAVYVSAEALSCLGSNYGIWGPATYCQSVWLNRNHSYKFVSGGGVDTNVPLYQIQNMNQWTQPARGIAVLKCNNKDLCNQFQPTNLPMPPPMLKCNVQQNGNSSTCMAPSCIIQLVETSQGRQLFEGCDISECNWHICLFVCITVT